MLNSIYSTPAGNFDSCAVYQYDITETHVIEVLRPRIGIVERDVKFDSFHNHGTYFHKIRLISYNLIR